MTITVLPYTSNFCGRIVYKILKGQIHLKGVKCHGSWGFFWDYFNIIPIHFYVQSSLAERTLFQCRLAYFENFQQCLRHPLLSLKVHLSFCLCAFQVSEQFESPSEAASSVGQLQPERRPHGSRALQGGDRHCRAHTSRYHIHHPVCLHLLLHT